MDSIVKQEIFNKINKIDNPVLLAELNQFLNQWDNPDTGVDDPELIKSIEQALSESKAGLGIKHEDIWQQLKSA